MTEPMPGSGTAALRVLVVDDEHSVLHATAALLQASGIDTATAVDGADAMRRLKDLARCDAVVLDLTMPGPSAADTLRELRTSWPELPVVFTSGYTERSTLSPLLAHPHTAFLQKPYDTTELVTAIDRLVRRHRTDAHR